MYKLFLKRLLDIVVSLSILLLFSPFLLLTIVLLYLFNKKQVFFVQQRPGKNEKIFSIVKLKTMTDERDAHGNLLPDSDRLTPLGKFIRKTSMDEIPQLWNVLKGDMSLIGPRPLLIRYLPFYTDKERKRHMVLPGITGHAQVSGRNHLNWDERLAKDVEYVDNISLTMDLEIILKTIRNVIGSKDIAVDASAVMPDLDEYRSKA